MAGRSAPRCAEFSNVPIIIFSALDSPGMVASALDAGADDYLVKPVPSGVLVAHLNKHARRHEMNGKNGVSHQAARCRLSATTRWSAQALACAFLLRGPADDGQDRVK